VAGNIVTLTVPALRRLHGSYQGPGPGKISHAEVSTVTTRGTSASWTPGFTDLGQLTDDERATILAVIDAITSNAKLRLITGSAS
jgi:hypothetical protein